MGGSLSQCVHTSHHHDVHFKCFTSISQKAGEDKKWRSARHRHLQVKSSAEGLSQEAASLLSSGTASSALCIDQNLCGYILRQGPLVVARCLPAAPNLQPSGFTPLGTKRHLLDDTKQNLRGDWPALCHVTTPPNHLSQACSSLTSQACVVCSHLKPGVTIMPQPLLSPKDNKSSLRQQSGCWEGQSHRSLEKSRISSLFKHRTPSSNYSSHRHPVPDAEESLSCFV